MGKWVSKTDDLFELGITKGQLVDIKYHSSTNKFIILNVALIGGDSLNEYFIKLSEHRNNIIDDIFNNF